jgi:hypothetical protein
MSNAQDFVIAGMIPSISYRTNAPEEIVHLRVTTRDGVAVVYVHRERDQPSRGFVPIAHFFQRLAHHEAGLMATGYRANGRQTTISFNKSERVTIAPALLAYLSTMAKDTSLPALEPVAIVHAPIPSTESRLAITARPAAKALRKGEAVRYVTGAVVDFAEYCCQGKGWLAPGTFVLDDLTMATEGRRRLRFAPLGNRPTAPQLALVGITPGGQIERFASLLSAHDVESAARQAAFHGAQTEIKQLLSAHGFAERLGISLDGDLNDNASILTTSVVKCCLMVDDGYKFAAPDIAASPAASRCATERLVAELRSFPTLRWVVVFGKPAWHALHELQIDSVRIIDVLRGLGLVVLQFPHFAQNFQQRALFVCDDSAESTLLTEKPDYVKYANAARLMRAAVVRELAIAQP